MSTSEQSGTKAAKPEAAKGKLGVMVVGLGAVATTMIAGVEAVRRGGVFCNDHRIMLRRVAN